MAQDFAVEPVADHQYLVRTEAAGSTVESRFHIDLDVLRQLDIDETDEQRVAEQTAVFLAERQPLDDFPPMVDLEDVIARYDDFPETLRRQLARS